MTLGKLKVERDEEEKEEKITIYTGAKFKVSFYTKVLSQTRIVHFQHHIVLILEMFWHASKYARMNLVDFYSLITFYIIYLKNNTIAIR